MARLLFQNASEAFKLANPHLLAGGAKKAPRRTSSQNDEVLTGPEKDFALRLEALKRNGEIMHQKTKQGWKRIH
jgi:hypothetical protein